MGYELALVIGLGITSIVMIIIATTMQKSHKVLQMLFLFFSMFVMLINLDSMSKLTATNSILQSNISILYISLLSVILFLMFYFVLKILLEAIGMYKLKKEKEREGVI